MLIHKMDLIPEKERDAVFEQRCKFVRENTQGFNVECFKTSIWDESL